MSGIMEMATRCRLYDENLVHNIIVSSGLSVLEYLNADSISRIVDYKIKKILEMWLEIPFKLINQPFC